MRRALIAAVAAAGVLAWSPTRAQAPATVQERVAALKQSLREITNLSHTISKIFFIGGLDQPARKRFYVAARQTAVSDKSFGENQTILNLLEQTRVARRQKPADVDESILFRAHRKAVGVGKNFARNFDN